MTATALTLPHCNRHPNANRITSDEEATRIARDLAAEFVVEAAARDRDRRLPTAELDRFSGSGLWGISVPKAYGGTGASFATLAKVIAIVSAADPWIGQIPQNHLAALDAGGRPDSGSCDLVARTIAPKHLSAAA